MTVPAAFFVLLVILLFLTGATLFVRDAAWLLRRWHARYTRNRDIRQRRAERERIHAHQMAQVVEGPWSRGGAA